MDEAVRLLRELRGAASVTEEQVARLHKVCKQLEVPRVTIYTPSGYEGWYEMQSAYVFTSRVDIHVHIWYFSSRRGLQVYDQNGENGVSLEQWDPKADLFVDDSLYEGGTNMNPVERERTHRE